MRVGKCRRGLLASWLQRCRNSEVPRPVLATARRSLRPCQCRCRCRCRCLELVRGLRSQWPRTAQAQVRLTSCSNSNSNSNSSNSLHRSNMRLPQCQCQCQCQYQCLCLCPNKCWWGLGVTKPFHLSLNRANRFTGLHLLSLL